MFDRVAPTYDLLNWFISLGQTTLWRLMAYRGSTRAFAAR